LQLADAAAAAAVPPTGPLPGAYRRMLLPLLEAKLSRGDYSLRDVEAAVVDIDLRQLANVNTEADLAALTPD
jgi:molybdopterin-guanine dinucleotide biosynthesis protein A